MSRRIRIMLIIAFYSLLLVIIPTMAWMLSDSIKTVRQLKLIFDEDTPLQVTSSNVEMELLVFNGEEFVLANRPDLIFNKTNMVPNQSIKFKFRIRNNSDADIVASLSFTRITTNKEEIFSQIYAGCNGAIGYPDYYENLPTSTCLKMDDSLNYYNGFYSFNFINALYIPPTQSGQYIELDCYFLFDRNADYTTYNNIELIMEKVMLTI